MISGDSLEAAAFFSQKGGPSSNYKGKGVATVTKSNYIKGIVFSRNNSLGGSSSSGGNYFGKAVSINNYKAQKKGPVVCEYCGYNGHTKESCYKLIGYPPDWPKSKKKGIN